jgi:molybdopterin biosynthesis enzyme
MKYVKIKKKKLQIKHSEEKNNNLTQFLRIKLYKNNTNLFRVYKNKDSSMQKILKESDGILIRKPYAKEISENSICDTILFNDSFTQEI